MKFQIYVVFLAVVSHDRFRDGSRDGVSSCKRVAVESGRQTLVGANYATSSVLYIREPQIISSPAMRLWNSTKIWSLIAYNAKITFEAIMRFCFAL